MVSFSPRWHSEVLSHVTLSYILIGVRDSRLNYDRGVVNAIDLNFPFLCLQMDPVHQESRNIQAVRWWRSTNLWSLRAKQMANQSRLSNGKWQIVLWRGRLIATIWLCSQLFSIDILIVLLHRYRDNELVQESSNHIYLDESLFILKVMNHKREKDTGVYYCLAKNAHGKARSHNATIEIACKFFLSTEHRSLNNYHSIKCTHFTAKKRPLIAEMSGVLVRTRKTRDIRRSFHWLIF